MTKEDIEFINTCIWSSCRYFIGRHTIASSMHAGDIARFLSKHPDIESRGEWLAKDIRREINQHMHFSLNVNVEGEGNVDACTLVFKAISEYLAKYPNEHIDTISDWRAKPEPGKFNPGHWKFRVNLTNKTCEMEYDYIEVDTRAYGPHPISDWLDLVPWIKLAGWLDPNEVIWFKNEEGEEVGLPGFMYPSVGRYEHEEHTHVEMRHCSAEHYLNHPNIDTSIREDVITKIDTLSPRTQY